MWGCVLAALVRRRSLALHLYFCSNSATPLVRSSCHSLLQCPGCTAERSDKNGNVVLQFCAGAELKDSEEVLCDPRHFARFTACLTLSSGKRVEQLSKWPVFPPLLPPTRRAVCPRLPSTDRSDQMALKGTLGCCRSRHSLNEPHRAKWQAGTESTQTRCAHQMSPIQHAGPHMQKSFNKVWKESILETCH